MKHLYRLSILNPKYFGVLIALIITVNIAFAQEAIIGNVSLAIRNSGAKELTKHFSESVEINLKGDKHVYSSTQAEFVMRSFFRDNPPKTFSVLHEGSSKEGLKYAIGKLQTTNNRKYRVYMVVKVFNGKQLIDTISFTEEGEE